MTDEPRLSAIRGEFETAACRLLITIKQCGTGVGARNSGRLELFHIEKLAASYGSRQQGRSIVLEINLNMDERL